MTKGMKKYFKKKIFWFIITFIAAVILNFILPRLMPGDPVNSIVGKNISPGATQEQVQEQMAYYQHQFGLDKNIFGQFWDFVKNAFNGTFGVSYSQYPRLVSDIIGSSIWWTVALQLPAIIVGWLLGNLLGALAAYKRSFYDKALMPLTLFFSACGVPIIVQPHFANGYEGMYSLQAGFHKRQFGVNIRRKIFRMQAEHRITDFRKTLAHAKRFFNGGQIGCWQEDFFGSCTAGTHYHFLNIYRIFLAIYVGMGINETFHVSFHD